MYWRRSIALLLVASWLALVISGCGGAASTRFLEDGNGSAGGTQVTGKVVLPPGSGLSLRDLSVVTVLGDGTIDSAGTFTAMIPENDMVLVLLLSPEGKVVLAGFSQADMEISSASTALSLLFVALGGQQLPSDQQPNVLRILSQSSALPTLIGALNTALQANANALTDGDPALVAALAAAQQAVIAEAGILPRRGTPEPIQAQSEPVHGQQVEPEVTVSPLSFQGGVSARAEQQQVKVTNLLRRMGSLYVFRTSYKDGSDVFHEENPYVRITPDGLFLSSVTGLQSAVGSLFDLLAGNIAWVPKEVTLSSTLFAANNHKQVNYLLLLVAPSLSGNQPIWRTSGNFSSADQEVLDLKFASLMIQGFFQDVILPASGIALGSRSMGGSLNTITWNPNASSALAQFAGGGEVLINQILAGTLNSWREGVLTFFGLVAQNPDFLIVLLKEMAPSTLVGNGALKLLTAFSKANMYLAAIDLALQISDLTLVLSAFQNNPSELWTVVVNQETPQPSSLEIFETQMLESGNSFPAMEAHTLRVFGKFNGIQPIIRVGGEVVPVYNFISFGAGHINAPEEVRCILPTTGPGSFGSIQAQVGGEISNQRTLTLWTGTISRRDTGPEAQTNDWDLTFSFRADIDPRSDGVVVRNGINLDCPAREAQLETAFGGTVDAVRINSVTQEDQGWINVWVDQGVIPSFAIQLFTTNPPPFPPSGSYFTAGNNFRHVGNGQYTAYLRGNALLRNAIHQVFFSKVTQQATNSDIDAEASGLEPGIEIPVDPETLIIPAGSISLDILHHDGQPVVTRTTSWTNFTPSGRP